MNKQLSQYKDIRKDGCVTITLNTHRTKPGYDQDRIRLKNLIKEAQDRLSEEFDKRMVLTIMEHLNRVAEKIDHSLNLESLVVFANNDFADYTRLPVSVTDRVVIDQTFATRDLIRAMHQEASYYILVLSRQKARLIEAHNDQAVREFSGEFPMEDYLYTADKLKLSTSRGQDNLIEEFFNRVDKMVMKITADNPLPIILATETRNADHFLKVADKKELVIGSLNRNRDEETAGNIAREAWEEVRAMIMNRNASRLEELQKAVGQNKFLSDYNDIWNAIRQGRGKTLFVKKGFYQPVLLRDDRIIPVDEIKAGQEGLVDDIIDEMIELNLKFGGDAVFLEGSEIKQFKNLALVTRY